jgi:hypothetical protein
MPATSLRNSLMLLKSSLYKDRVALLNNSKLQLQTNNKRGRGTVLLVKGVETGHNTVLLPNVQQKTTCKWLRHTGVF